MEINDNKHYFGYDENDDPIVPEEPVYGYELEDDLGLVPDYDRPDHDETLDAQLAEWITDDSEALELGDEDDEYFIESESFAPKIGYDETEAEIAYRGTMPTDVTSMATYIMDYRHFSNEDVARIIREAFEIQIYGEDIESLRLFAIDKAVATHRDVIDVVRGELITLYDNMGA